MRVLDLYAGIGGNRKLWKDVDVTAVELDSETAAIYQDFFPNDRVVVADAHKFLEEHYNDGWDFIWSSPPCPTHSRIRNVAGVGRGQNKPVYPDMKLYQEIIFLNQIYSSGGTNYSGKWVVENVISYYPPLIKPKRIGRHYFWSNFNILDMPDVPKSKKEPASKLQSVLGIYLDDYDIPMQKKLTLLRNCTHPNIGYHVFRNGMRIKQKRIEEAIE